MLKRSRRKNIFLTLRKIKIDMKSFITNLLKISALFAIIFITSCGEESPKNYFKVGEDIYELNFGCITNKGEVEGGFDLELSLYSADGKNIISFRIVSEQAESIASGTYKNLEGSWVVGYENGSYTNMASINYGKVLINRSPAGYSVEIKCTDQYSSSISGYFKGDLGKIDENNQVHKLPNYVLPEELYDEVTKYLPIHSGINPPDMSGEYVSAPHALIYESYGQKPDSVQFYSDRYLGFMYSNKQMNFYGKQYDSLYKKYIEEVQYGVKITGDDDNFTCYYVVDGYVEGYYAQQSFIFSGKKIDAGLEDFHVAVVLLENSNNPNMYPKHSYRVLKDYDGLAETNYWLSGKSGAETIKNTNPFDIWMR